MPTDRVLFAFNSAFGQIAQLVRESEFDAALHLLSSTKAELLADDDDKDGWLHRSYLESAALIYQEKGDAESALSLYSEAQALSPPPSEFMVNQLGICRLFYNSARHIEAVEALEIGLSAADEAIATAAGLLRLYVQVAAACGRDVPIRWSSVYLRSCARLGVRPNQFDETDEHSFSVALAETRWESGT